MATLAVMDSGTWTTAASKPSLAFGDLEYGVLSAEQEMWVWNGFPSRVVAEAVGTGDNVTETFSLDHSGVCSPCLIVYLDGVAATSGVDYTPDHTAGTVTFLSGHIPGTGVAITATYLHTMVTGDLDTVHIVARRKLQMLGVTSQVAFVLAVAVARVFEVYIDGTQNTDWAFSASTNTLTFDTAPTEDATIVVYCEDETATQQVFRTRSYGISDPYGGSGMSSDAEATATAIGGATTISTWTYLGVGDASETQFEIGYSPIVAGSVSVKVGDTETTDFTVATLTGIITLGSAPASGVSVYAKYTYEHAHQIGAISAGCARQIYVKALVPLAPTLSGGLAEIDFVAV